VSGDWDDGGKVDQLVRRLKEIGRAQEQGNSSSAGSQIPKRR
jgi:hypothetical protein